jgi:hypothetical protein
VANGIETTGITGTIAGVSSQIGAAARGVSKRLVSESAAGDISTGNGIGGQVLSMTHATFSWRERERFSGLE